MPASTTEPTTYRDFYEAEADVYRITEESEDAFTHRRTLIQRILPRDAGPRILDAGCGDGSLAKALREWTGAEVFGMDLATKRVAYGKQHVPTVRFTQGSIYQIPFGDGAFDTVVCTDVLEHLDEPQKAVSELVRVASRYVVVSVPYDIKIEMTLCPHCNKEYYLYGHQHSFGKEGIEQLAQGAGARVARFEHIIPMFECRRYRYFPFLKWLIWGHFKNTGTLGAVIAKP